jgi:hypothetical protein
MEECAMTQIQGTPIEIALWYVPAGGSPPPLSHPLERATGGGSWAVTILGAIVVGMLPASQQAKATNALDTPLDQLFDANWTSLLALGTPQQAVQQAVKSNRPTAYNIDVTFPSSGTLDASVGVLSGPLAGLLGLPPAWAGSLLTLQYALQSAVTITWHETTNSIFGSWADPSYRATFDGTLQVLVAVPADPAAGLTVQAGFQATNIQAGLDGFSIGNVVEVLEIGWDYLTNQAVPGSIPDQDVPASVGIQQAFDLLSVGFAAAGAQGFGQLSVTVNNQAQPPAWPQAVPRVEFDLVHSSDPGPTAQAGQVGVFKPGPPQISASPASIPASSQFGVTGVNFPAQTTQLTIGWIDTTSGPVTQSEVQWGTVIPTILGQPLDVQVIGDQLVARSGPGDGRNTFTATNLSPGTRYAFRIRDYDVSNQAATGWGNWLVLTTTATAQVQLVLSDAAGTLLGATQVQPDGSVSATITMPAGETPGSYTLWATMDGQHVASTTITVLAEGSHAPAQIEVYNPDTGLTVPAPAGVTGEYQVDLRGYNFEPGPVHLFVDSVAGLSLGSPQVASAAQDPGGQFTAAPTWPNGADGPHNIVAEQAGSVVASIPVYGQNVPQ